MNRVRLASLVRRMKTRLIDTGGNCFWGLLREAWWEERKGCEAGRGTGSRLRSVTSAAPVLLLPHTVSPSGGPRPGLGVPQPGLFAWSVWNARIVTTRRLHVSQGLRAADLGCEVAEQRQLLHHAEV